MRARTRTLLALVAVVGLALPAADGALANGMPIEMVRGSPAGVTALRVAHAGEFVVPLHKSQLLRIDQEFEEVSVGNAEIADVVPITPQLLYVLGRQTGTTNLTVLGPEGRVIAVADLVVTHDVESLKAKLHELMPTERIEVRPAGNSVVLSGQVSSASAAANALSVAERYAPERVTNMLMVGGSQQVMLAVRFAEVSRSLARQLGLSGRLLRFGSTSFDFQTGDAVFGAPGEAFVSGESFAAGLLSLMGSRLSLDLVFEALEDKGALRMLAEPNLSVLSGDTASFLAGGEFPVPVAQEGSEGGFAITVEFKEFGVGLSFTPTVVQDGLINLALNTEVSAIDPGTSVVASGFSIPGLSARRARTTIELSDGESFAIAGLLQDDFSDAVRQFPILGDIPVLGTLFRSTEFQRRQTELVVLVTPHLVRPVARDTLRIPSMPLPAEGDLFLMGRTDGGVPPPGELLGMQAAGGIDGVHGYILP
jgi:pilus assembly protein CpaC